MTQRILGHGLRAWLSAHNKLSVGCGRGGLRKEVASSLRHNVLISGFREPDDRDRIPKQGLGDIGSEDSDPRPTVHCLHRL